MYQSHPTQSENFDFKQFSDQHLDTLRELFDETKEYIDESISENPIENQACLVCLAVYNNLMTLKGADVSELDYEEEEGEAMASFFDRIVALCTLFDMSDKGIVKMGDEEVSLTSYGKKFAARSKKKSEILKKKN
jgi:hypothetical protein